MPARQRNEAFFAPASGGEQALQKVLVAARESGACNLRGRQLRQLPPACLDINSVQLPEGGQWWLMRETLEKIDASQNELTSLPELVTLPELRELLLNHNQLEHLPSFAAQTELKLLELSHNRLSSLPDDFGAGAVPPLARLSCAQNRLVTLPRSLAGLSTLQQLDLSHNKLSALPDGLSALTQLRSANLSHNELRALPADMLACAAYGRSSSPGESDEPARQSAPRRIAAHASGRRPRPRGAGGRRPSCRSSASSTTGWPSSRSRSPSPRCACCSSRTTRCATLTCRAAPRCSSSSRHTTSSPGCPQARPPPRSPPICLPRSHLRPRLLRFTSPRGPHLRSPARAPDRCVLAAAAQHHRPLQQQALRTARGAAALRAPHAPRAEQQ